MDDVQDVNVEEVINEIRDVRNSIAVFSKEYNLPQDIVNKLEERLDKVVYKLSSLEEE